MRNDTATQAARIERKLADGSASALEAMRAFGVVFGPSGALDAAVAASIVRTVRAARRRRRPPLWAAAGTAALALYATLVRPWIVRWGATAEEVSKPLPGDEFVPDPGGQVTRAVTIDAPVSEVWPWLAQIGQDRAGFYSHEWLENLAGCRMRGAEEIHPEWQERQLGETVYLHHLYGMPVARFERERVIALKGWGAFVVQVLPGERTRLIARSRAARGPAVILGALLIDIPHFVMERKMLLGIKRLAERGRVAKVPTSAKGADSTTAP